MHTHISQAWSRVLGVGGLGIKRDHCIARHGTLVHRGYVLCLVLRNWPTPS